MPSGHYLLIMKSHYTQFEKAVVNIGVGRLSSQPNFEDKLLPEIMRELSLITGQKAATRPATQSIAGFKTRAGTIVGLKTTLRGNRLREFLGKFIHVVLPRVRDFRGLSPRGFDQAGNYNFGIQEQNIFPELETDRVLRIQGMNITIVIDSRSKEESYELLTLFGVPFRVKTEKAVKEETHG